MIGTICAMKDKRNSSLSLFPVPNHKQCKLRRGKKKDEGKMKEKREKEYAGSRATNKRGNKSGFCLLMATP